MNTIVLEEPGRFVMTSAPAPAAPGPGEALVRVRTIGICGTDLHAFRGRQPFFTYPRILGHELAVEVADVGAGVESVKPGDRCAVNPYMNCGECSACIRGKTNCCDKLKVIGVHVDGGMRDQILIPAAHLYPSTKLTLSQLALVETLGIGAHAVKRAAPEPGERVLVIGAGPIGLSVITFLKTERANIALFEIDDRRAAFCRETYAVDRCYRSAEEVKKDDLPTIVIDCTGNKDSMMGALQLMANGGKLVFVGLFVGDFTFHDPEFHRRETTLLSSRNCTAPEHRRIINLIEAGRIDVTPWVSDRVAAADMIGRFPHWLDRDSGVVKAIVEWV
jgi:threonine dehydrogenase-like Zn-dependent dehydrogenase